MTITELHRTMLYRKHPEIVKASHFRIEDFQDALFKITISRKYINVEQIREIQFLLKQIRTKYDQTNPASQVERIDTEYLTNKCSDCHGYLNGSAKRSFAKILKEDVRYFSFKIACFKKIKEFATQISLKLHISDKELRLFHISGLPFSKSNYFSDFCLPKKESHMLCIPKISTLGKLLRNYTESFLIKYNKHCNKILANNEIVVHGINLL